jgi:hypothetical protein
MTMRVVKINRPIYRSIYRTRFAEITWEAPCTSGGTIPHGGAHLMAVGNRTIILFPPRSRFERIFPLSNDHILNVWMQMQNKYAGIKSSCDARIPIAQTIKQLAIAMMSPT